MNLGDLFARLYDINSEISGITRAFERPPMKLDTDDIPACMVDWRNPMATYSTYAASGRRTDWHLQIEIWGYPSGQRTDYAERQQDLEAFPERVFDAYEAAVKLDELTGVQFTNLGAVRFVWRTYGGEVSYPVLEFDLDVIEKTAITLSN